MVKIASYLLISILITCASAEADQNCFNPMPVLEQTLRLDSGEATTLSLTLPSRYHGEIVLTPVMLHLHWEKAPLWTGDFAFPNNPNIDYTVYRITLELTNGTHSMVNDIDFTRSCSKMGLNLQPGNFVRFAKGSFEGFQSADSPVFLKIRLWAH